MKKYTWISLGLILGLALPLGMQDAAAKRKVSEVERKAQLEKKTRTHQRIKGE